MRRRAFAALVALLVVPAACDTDDGREMRPAEPDQTASILTTTTAVPEGGTELDTVATTTPVLPPEVSQLSLTTPWPDTGAIDALYTCTGDDVSPALSWAGVSSDAEELALAMIDLDADGFVHWVVWGIVPDVTELAQGDVPPGAQQARNDFGDVGYGGPCPPSGEHEYLLTLYELAAQVEVVDGVNGQTALAAIEGASVGQVSRSGTYAKP